MSTEEKHTARPKRSDVPPSNEVVLPGTVGTTQPEPVPALVIACDVGYCLDLYAN